MPNVIDLENGKRLKKLRESAKLSQRDLATLIGETHTNIAYWETSGNLPRSNVLIPIAKALGVSVEEVLGEPKPKRSVAPSGRARQIFEKVSKLPRNQQQRIISVVEALVAQNANAH